MNLPVALLLRVCAPDRRGVPCHFGSWRREEGRSEGAAAWTFHGDLLIMGGVGSSPYVKSWNKSGDDHLEPFFLVHAFYNDVTLLWMQVANRPNPDNLTSEVSWTYPCLLSFRLPSHLPVCVSLAVIPLQVICPWTEGRQLRYLLHILNSFLTCILGDYKDGSLTFTARRWLGWLP
jgi:hypothetical protein